MLKPALNSLVWYKGRPALVVELGEKITISAAAAKGTETIKVREKDIEALHPGPLKDLAGLSSAAPDGAASQSQAASPGADIQGAWELIESGGVAVSLRELAELAYGEFTPQSAWAARLLLAEGLYFTGTIDAVTARSAADVREAEEKRQGKAKEGKEREEFLARLRNGVFAPDDRRFFQDVEALAYGTSAKSRTLKELGHTETPQEAHRLLLKTGFWDKWVNPHPRRFGLSPGTHEDTPFLGDGQTTSESSSTGQTPAPLERRDLTHLPAFAIDSPWSADPDDALSLESAQGRRILYVHVADPASVIAGDTPADHFARARGATLYFPEGTWPMLGEAALARFALGLVKGKPDQALTFKITLDDKGNIEDTEIFPSLIMVTRFTYEQADACTEKTVAGDHNGAVSGDAAVLKDLFALAEQNLERRLDTGAVNISFPEAHIVVADHRVEITPIVSYRSADMVRECMLLAGEAAAAWASQRRLPFPYITQEGGDLPAKPLPGLAGSYQLRRCMRPRSVSAKPGYHWGLGLEAYSQVTSPLRRYTDLLAHQQIYALLRKEAGAGGNNAGSNGGNNSGSNNAGAVDSVPEILSEEDLLFRLAAGDAAAQAITQAERASKSHWIAVYLDELLAAGTEMLWDAVVTEKRANGLGIIIPALGLETQTGGAAQPNDTIKLRVKSVRLPELEINFVQEK